jgi:hypothetical protein
MTVIYNAKNIQPNIEHLEIKTEIQSHEPEKFEKIRMLDGISSEMLLKSLSLEKNRSRVFKAGQGAG